MIRNLTSVSTLALSLFALGGCLADTGTLEHEGNATEGVESSLGETSCNTQSCTSANSCSSLAIPARQSCSYTYASYTTPSRTYGSSVCPSQYTIRATGSTTTTFRPFIEWADTPPTSANCSSATLTLSTFQKSATTISYKMSSYHGVWIGGIFNTCEFELNSGSSHPPQTNIDGQTVRASGSAMLSGSRRKVTVGWQVGTGPC
jgi:hypothetical protein